MKLNDCKNTGFPKVGVFAVLQLYVKKQYFIRVGALLVHFATARRRTGLCLSWSQAADRYHSSGLRCRNNKRGEESYDACGPRGWPNLPSLHGLQGPSFVVCVAGSHGGHSAGIRPLILDDFRPSGADQPRSPSPLDLKPPNCVCKGSPALQSVSILAEM